MFHIPEAKEREEVIGVVEVAEEEDQKTNEVVALKTGGMKLRMLMIMKRTGE